MLKGIDKVIFLLRPPGGFVREIALLSNKAVSFAISWRADI